MIAEHRDARVPYIILTDITRSSEPLQIGGGEWAVIDVTLEIGEYDSGAYSARSRAEELADIIISGLHRIPIVDFENGTRFPLTLSGDFNSNYDLEAQTIGRYTLVEGSPTTYELPISTRGFVRRIVRFSVMTPVEE